MQYVHRMAVTVASARPVNIHEPAAELDRHGDAEVTGLFPQQPAGRAGRTLRWSNAYKLKTSVTDEMRIEHIRRLLGRSRLNQVANQG